MGKFRYALGGSEFIVFFAYLRCYKRGVGWENVHLRTRLFLPCLTYISVSVLLDMLALHSFTLKFKIIQLNHMP